MINLNTIREKYEATPDFKLIKLASEAYQLSEDVQQILRTELKNRGIVVEIVTSKPEEEDYPSIEDDGIDVNMFVIAFFSDYHQAVLASSFLGSEDILSFISDSHTNFTNLLGIYKSYGNNNRLSVSAKDVERAKEILKEAGYEKFLC